jgi:hypothetical protein
MRVVLGGPIRTGLSLRFPKLVGKISGGFLRFWALSLTEVPLGVVIIAHLGALTFLPEIDSDHLQ